MVGANKIFFLRKARKAAKLQQGYVNSVFAPLQALCETCCIKWWSTRVRRQ